MRETPSRLPLRVLLQFSRAKEAGDPYAFRFEPQDYIVPSEGGASPSARFEWTQAVLDDLRALRLPGRDPEVVQRMGERLRQFVLSAGWADWERQIAQALADERPVFLSIRSSAAELYALPWELLSLKSGQLLGELDGVLLRFEWPESETAPEQPSPRPEGGRILVAWSAAAGAVPASEHISAIADACAAGFVAFDAVSDVLANASLPRLIDTLREAERAQRPFAVLHLLCHGAEAGSSFGLALDGEGEAVVVDAQQLRQGLAPLGKSLRLIVLSACDSGNSGALGSQLGSVARELHRSGMQAVIASRYPLSVAGSITLTESFYRALLVTPSSVEAALVAARRQLALAETRMPRAERALDWASLQLYARHSDGDDTRPLVFRPFRGLLAFQPEHQRFFYGREREVGEVLRDLQALRAGKKPRFLVVAGASGTGKSSLVLAGALPQLRAQQPQWLFLRMRPGSDPARALDEALSQLPAGEGGLLVVDQFEEIFTQTADAAARQALVRRLWALAQATAPEIFVIVTLRVDFIGRCGELVLDDTGLRLDRVAYDESHRVFVAQLEPAQLRASIVEPARKVGLDLQAGLVDRMVAEVGGEPGALPLLEDALDVLWQRRSGRLLTQAAYDALGGVVGALQTRADAILDGLSAAEQVLAQRLLIGLVAVADDTALDTRLRVPLSRLAQDAAAHDAAGFDRVLRALVSARLLVQGDDRQAPTVEVAHEALIRKWPRLRAWLDEDRAGLVVQRRVRQAAEAWAQQGRDESLLYRGAQLVQASEWRKTRDARLGELERSFLAGSEALRHRQEQEAEQRLQAEQKRARQTRLAAFVLAALFVVGLATAGLAIWNWRKATRSEAQAQQKSEESYNRLLLATAQLVKKDPTAVVTLVREAKALDRTLWTQTALDALRAGVADVVLRGHLDEVLAVAISRDGKRIATAGRDKTARIWNADGSGGVLVLRGHEDFIRAIAFHPDGKALVTGSADKTVRIWNADGSGSPIVLRGHSAGVEAVAFSPDGQKLASGGWDSTVRIWSRDGSGSPLVAPWQGSAALAVAFSPDGSKVLVGSQDHRARIWNVDGTGEPLLFRGHQFRVTSVAFSPDGRRFVTGSEDKTARIWSSDGEGQPMVLSGHDATVTAVAFSPDGKTVLTGSSDETVRLWSMDGFRLPRIVGAHRGEVTAVALSSDGMRFVSGGTDQTAKVWQIESPQAWSALGRHADAVPGVALSPDGTRLATACSDGTAWVWHTDGSGTSVVLRGHKRQVRAVAFSPDGQRVATASMDGTARVFRADGTGAEVVLSGQRAELFAVAFSPDGQRVATGDWNGTARIFRADGSGSALVLSGHRGSINGVAFSPDGKRLVTGGYDNIVRIWNSDGTGSPVALTGHESFVSAVAFSPDGRQIASVSGDKTVRIWYANAPGLARVFTGHRDTVTSVAYRRDGGQIATGSRDGTVRLWNPDGSGSPIVLAGTEGTVASVVFSPDGQRLYSSGDDPVARAWTIGGDALRELLWNVTTDCLPVPQRRELLNESLLPAEQSYQRCAQEVARRRRFPGSQPQ